MHATIALTFLDPLAGIIAASIATPALLLLYFLRLRRRPLRISSTLLWEKAAQDLQVNAPFQWIRPSWLLVLQLLILACLCIAVARPTIDRPTTESDRVAIIIDTSASMRAPDAEGDGSTTTRFDAARDRATEIIRRLPGSTEVMLISSSAEAITIAPFSRDRGMLRGAIDALEPTDQPGDLAAALALVAAAGTQSASEDAPVQPLRAIVLSDAGFPSSESIPSAGRASVELLRVGPDPGGPRDNIAILSMAAKRDYDDPSIVRLFLRVSSWRDTDTTATIRIDLDGAEHTLQTIAIPGETEDGPGVNSTTIEIVAPTASLVAATLLERDLLESDNTTALRLGPASGPRILIVQPGPPDHPGDYALVEAVSILETAGVSQMTAEEFNKLQPGAPAFRDHDLVILDRVTPDALPPIPSLSFDATLPIPGLALLEATAASERFVFWNRAHPLLRYAPLGDVKVNSPRVIEIPEGALRTPSGVVRTEVLASGSRDPLMLLLEEGSIRRVIIAFSLRRTRWWTDASFPVFMSNAVDFLSGSARVGSGTALSTVEPITIPAPAGSETVITGPDRFERRTTASPEGIARIGSIPNVGIFLVRIAGASAGAIATNLLSEQESSLVTNDDITIDGRTVQAGTLNAMAPREIRDWFVALAILLLMFEWLLFAWRMRL